MDQRKARGVMRWMLAAWGLPLLLIGCAQPPPTPILTLQAPPTPIPSIIAPTLPPAPIASSTPTPPESSTPAPSTTLPPTATPLPTTPACADTHGQVLSAQFNSQILKHTAQYNLYLPPCYSQAPTRLYPALYLLHGANADDTQWLDLNVASDADELISQHTIAPLVIIIPDSDPIMGESYGAFILSDLIPQIEKTTRVDPRRAARAIGGISRGGYWALQLALTHPDLFSAAGGHSPATYNSMLSNAAAGWQQLHIYLDIGRDDTLAPGVESFVAALQAAGVSPEFHLNTGNHNRPYWRSHTVEYLEFYNTAW